MFTVTCFKALLLRLSIHSGELAPALLATVSISGQHVDFVVVHMGNDRYAIVIHTILIVCS